MRLCAKGTPTLRRVVESVKSRWSREMGSFIERCVRTASATPRLPSAFSKSMGLTLWGMADEPTSFAFTFWRKYSMEMYIHTSLQRSMSMVFMRRMQSKRAARLS